MTSTLINPMANSPSSPNLSPQQLTFPSAPSLKLQFLICQDTTISWFSSDLAAALSVSFC